jgi:hypothetical protein
MTESASAPTPTDQTTPNAPQQDACPVGLVGVCGGMSKTRDYLLSRRREIEAQAAPYLSELSDIDAALTALGSKPSKSTHFHRDSSNKKLSVDKQVIETLRENPEGLRTQRLGMELNVRYGRQLSTKNLSWYCSRLKKRLLIKQDGELWKLPS